MFQAASCHSLDYKADQIVATLVDAARQEFADTPPQAAIVLAAPGLDHQAIVTGIQTAFSDIALIGASTHAEVSSVHGYQEDSVTAMFLGCDTVDFGAGLGEGLTDATSRAARRAVNQARGQLGDSPALCITTPEALGPNGSRVIHALQGELGDDIPIVGGVAGDQYPLEQTNQFFGGRTLRDSLPVLLLSGPVACSHGVASGWVPLGETAQITRAGGNVLYELNGQTAMDFYRKFIGDPSIQDGVYPLAVYEDDTDRFYLRARAGVDPKQGSITFFGDVPVGATAQMTRGERKSVIAATRTSVEDAYAAYPAGGHPSACLVFSCAGRANLLGSQTGREYHVLREVLPRQSPVCGFYTYGEIGPLGQGTPSRFHNDTFVTVLIGEANS